MTFGMKDVRDVCQAEVRPRERRAAAANLKDAMVLILLMYYGWMAEQH
jgi:hypothetical protein